MAATKTKNVLLPVADGSEDIEVVAVFDVLTRAGANVTTAAINSKSCKSVQLSNGIIMVASATIEECSDKIYDVIVIPGGLKGSESCRDSSILQSLLREQKKSGRICSAICAAPSIVFNELGLLDDDIQSVAYPSFMKNLKNPGEGRVCISKNFITSIGPGSAIEFALSIVKVIFGAERSEKIKSGMCVQ